MYNLSRLAGQLKNIHSLSADSVRDGGREVWMQTCLRGVLHAIEFDGMGADKDRNFWRISMSFEGIIQASKYYSLIVMTQAAAADRDYF